MNFSISRLSNNRYPGSLISTLQETLGGNYLIENAGCISGSLPG
ncbi:hypothetical protein [Dyadobacter sp. Leaf189]|nr:hypothetical protein [Dyadobacter sp. Leaf189]